MRSLLFCKFRAGTTLADSEQCTDPLSSRGGSGGNPGGSAVPVTSEEDHVYNAAGSTAAMNATSAPQSQPQSASAGPQTDSQSGVGTSSQRQVLSNGSAVQWKAPAWWQLILTIKSVLLRIVTTVVAVAWAAVMVGVLLWLCRLIIGSVALQLLPAVAGSVGVA